MGLHDLIRPNSDDADSIDSNFIKNRAGTILPANLSEYENPRAIKRRKRVVRIAQYYLWISASPESPFSDDIRPSNAREKAMANVEIEMDDVDRTKLLNAVYGLYDGTAEGSDALEQFEADLERLAFAYEDCENSR